LHLDRERLFSLSLPFELPGASWQGWDGVGWDRGRSEGQGSSNMRRHIQLENHGKNFRMSVQAIRL